MGENKLSIDTSVSLKKELDLFSRYIHNFCT